MEDSQILKRSITRYVTLKARPALTPLLNRMAGNLDTVADLKKKILELKNIVAHISDIDEKSRMWSIIAPEDIFAIRKALRLPQSKFGRLFGATRFTVSNWEHGKTIPHLVQRRELFELAELSLKNLENILRKYRG